MTLSEYVTKVKEEMDDFEAMWVAWNKKYPNEYPMKMDKEGWEDQELAVRFETSFL